MIDLEKARQYFNQYVSHYDPSVSRIRLKITHIEYVTSNSRNIAKMLGLSPEDQDLAELIGLLHDIGRFEQIRKYNTFSDKISVNHAEKGIEVLFADGEIRHYLSDSQYDPIIRKAILNHNRYQIENGLSEREQLFCNIIRDADKLDIFRCYLTDKIEDLVHIESEDVAAETLSPECYQAFHEGKPLRFADCKTNIDFIVCILAFIYDFNFKEALALIYEQDCIHRIIQRLDVKDRQTRKQLDELAKYATEFLENRVNQS